MPGLDLFGLSFEQSLDLDVQDRQAPAEPVFNVLEKDAVRLQPVYGEGIASYVKDGGVDLAPAADWGAGMVTDLGAEAVPLIRVLAYYDHWWNDQSSSSMGYSFTEVDNTDFQDPGAFEMIDYAQGNLLYCPADTKL